MARGAGRKWDLKLEMAEIWRGCLQGYLPYGGRPVAGLRVVTRQSQILKGHLVLSAAHMELSPLAVLFDGSQPLPGHRT